MRILGKKRYGKFTTSNEYLPEMAFFFFDSSRVMMICKAAFKIKPRDGIVL